MILGASNWFGGDGRSRATAHLVGFAGTNLICADCYVWGPAVYGWAEGGAWRRSGLAEALGIGAAPDALIATGWLLLGLALIAAGARMLTR
jgi:hypothetical protein